MVLEILCQNCQELLKSQKDLKDLEKKNIKVYTPLPDDSPEITKLFRDTAWARNQKQQQLTEILKRFEKKPVHRFYPRVSERYKNFKKRKVAQ